MVDETQSDEVLSRYQRVQQLAERRAEERRKRLRLYWWLLGLALALAVAILFVGRPAEFPSPDEIAEVVTPKVAASLPGNDGFRQQLQNQVSASMPTPAAYAPEVVSAVGADPELAARFRELAGHGEAELAALSRQVQRRVEQSIGGGPAVAWLEERLAAVEQATEELGRQGDPSVDHRLDEASASLSRIEEQTAATDRRLEELAAEVAELKRLVLPSLSWVVKAGAESRIPELGLTLEVGRLEDRSLAAVRVLETASGRQLYPRAGEVTRPVALGEPLTVDHPDYRMQLTFGYSVNRWVRRDLIGVEIRRWPR